MNNPKIAAIVVIAIIAMLLAGIIIQHPEILRTTPAENPPFITEQEIPVQKMAGVLIFIIVTSALLGLKAVAKENRCTI